MKKLVIVALILTGTMVIGRLAHQEWERTKREQRCQQFVQEAYQKAKADIKRQAKEFASFVEAKKAGAAAFSEDASGAYSKWRKLKEFLPGTDPDGHRQFIRETFAKHLFSEEEIGQKMRQAIDGAVKDIEGVENELAVKLRQETIGQPIETSEIASVQAEFRRLLNAQVNASGKDAASGAIQLAGSELAAQIGAQVVLKLATSAGLIGAGAATGWWTFGAGLAIGLAVDAIWTAVTDPAGKIKAEVLKALDQLAASGTDSIETELVKVLDAKKAQWNLYVARIAGARPTVP